MRTLARGKMNTFPCKLYELLERVDRLGHSHIISWQPGGKSFRVWKPKLLESVILPQHFKQSKFKSFLRQLNTYHFQRITSGVNRGGYAHPAFARGKPELCQNIRRIPDPNESSPSISSTSSPLKPDTETQIPRRSFCAKSFFDVKDTFPPVPPIPQMELDSREESIKSKTELTSKDLDVFVDLFEPSGPRAFEVPEPSLGELTPSEVKMFSETAPETVSPSPSSTGEPELEPIPIVSGAEPAAAPATVPIPAQPATTTVGNSDLNRSESTFPRKVYRMLQDVEKTNMDHIVSWINDGTAFRVHNQEAFVKHILPLYFDQTVYESFRRQLNMYGFTRVTRGPLKGTCYHKNFCLHNPSLLDKISRRKRPNKKAEATEMPQRGLMNPTSC